MPFLSPKRKVSDTENKLRVLFCLDQLGMATQEQLWPFVAQLELMEYVPLCVFVDELKSDGAISCGTHAMEGCLYLTSAGRQQLALFSGKMPHADRQRIAKAAPAYARSLSDRRQVHAAYELSQNGEYRAMGAVREGDVPSLLVRVGSRDERMIERFVGLFSSFAAQMMAQLYLLPLERSPQAVPPVQTQEEALESAAPGRPALCAYGGREHAAVVCVQDAQARYTVLLLLPSAEMAWGWALAAQAASAQTAQGLTALIRGERP